MPNNRQQKGHEMNELIVVEKIAQWQRLKALVLDSVSSPITKRVYSMAPGSRHFRYRFAENLPGTSLITASKTRSFQPKLYFIALPAQVSQMPEVCTVAAARKLTAGGATRELLDVNIQQKPIIDTLDAIEQQSRTWQDCLRMARGRCHCKLSLKQYMAQLFWVILACPALHRKCGRSIFAPALTLWMITAGLLELGVFWDLTSQAAVDRQGTVPRRQHSRPPENSFRF